MNGETMKTLFKKTIAAFGFSVCFFTVTAQEQIYTTIKDTFFVFTAIVQKPDDGTNQVRITNKDILTTLNATNNFNFDKHTKLLLQNVNDDLPTFIVRESTSNVTTNNKIDVSDTLTLIE